MTAADEGPARDDALAAEADDTAPLLLTGRPGVGKSTALRRAAERLADLRIAGFYTEEPREPTPVVATVARHGGGLIREVREAPGAKILDVTSGNRDGMPERIVAWVRRRTRPGPER